MNSSIELFNNIEAIGNSKKIINENWSRKSNKNFSKMHSISSYLGMFAPSLPNFFIKKYSNKKDLIMDSFSGRGTTGLVCRELNRRFIGTDLNPYSIVLSRSKIDAYKMEDLIIYINKLKKEFYKNTTFFIEQVNRDKYIELLFYYSDKTLSQLIFIREKIGKNWRKNSSVENAILAFTLGLMNGPKKKDGETIYFSLNMPNTISMSPNYIKNYAKNNNLVKPNDDIFEKIINRIKFKYDEKIIPNYFEGEIIESNAILNNKKIKNNSIKLVITSPPYLDIVDYTKSNWLKLWLLGYERNNLNEKIKLADKLNINEYIEFIEKYLNTIYDKIKKNGIVCLVIGDIFNKSLIEEVWKSVEKNVKFKFKELYIDNKYSQKSKITNMLNSRKGKATRLEKVLVLIKIT